MISIDEAFILEYRKKDIPFVNSLANFYETYGFLTEKQENAFTDILIRNGHSYPLEPTQDRGRKKLIPSQSKTPNIIKKEGEKPAVKKSVEEENEKMIAKSENIHKNIIQNLLICPICKSDKTSQIKVGIEMPKDENPQTCIKFECDEGHDFHISLLNYEGMTYINIVSSV